jgi:hypothetical protein
MSDNHPRQGLAIERRQDLKRGKTGGGYALRGQFGIDGLTVSSYLYAQFSLGQGGKGQCQQGGECWQTSCVS